MSHHTLTPHARERCAEMGVVTKRAKRIAADPDTTYGNPDERGVVATREDDPEIAVVVRRGRIITVLWRTQEVYCR